MRIYANLLSKYVGFHKIIGNLYKVRALSGVGGDTHFLCRQSQRFLVTSPVAKTELEMVELTFVRSDGSRIKTKGKLGDNLLDVVVNNSLDLDGFGACEGTLACSTCHVIFKQQDFDKIKDKLSDEEMDMLDMAFGLCDTSRLGCQVCLTKDLEGIEVKVPEGVNDARSS